MTPRRLPDGSTTTDDDAYVKAWRTIGERIEQELGLALLSCHPQLMFHDMDESTVVLPQSVAKSVLRVIDEARQGKLKPG